jgi:hypothetical protein
VFGLIDDDESAIHEDGGCTGRLHPVHPFRRWTMMWLGVSDEGSLSRIIHMHSPDYPQNQKLLYDRLGLFRWYKRGLGNEVGGGNMPVRKSYLWISTCSKDFNKLLEATQGHMNAWIVRRRADSAKFGCVQISSLVCTDIYQHPVCNIYTR